MGLSSKLVSTTEGLELDNWSCSQSLFQDDPPIPISTKLPLPPPPPLPPSAMQPRPAMRHPQPSHNRNQTDPLKCPRCDSMNTKFCYYNNYNKSQPRHFCKSCKRHWTKGGTLRNVPVGGGRKTKRQKTSSTESSTPAASTSVGVFRGSSEHTSNDSRDDPVSLLPSNQDGLNHLFMSDMEDSIIASLLSTASLSTWHMGIGSGTATAAASLWRWEDVDTLVSTSEGVPWDEYWGVGLP